MTETTEPTDDVEVLHDEAPEPTPEPEPIDKPSREAAKYRKALRDTEAQRDVLAEQVTALQRAEVERLASAKLAKPAGVWSAGATVDELLDDDGNVDPAKVDEAVAAAIATNGLEKKRHGPIIPGQGKQPERPVPLNTWEKAFGPPAA